MVLNSIFSPTSAEISDSGYMSVATGDNIAKNAIITLTTADTSPGIYSSVFDEDQTTYIECVEQNNHTSYMHFDLGRKYTKLTILTYYTIYHQAGFGITSNTAIWQSSNDNTTWTDLETQSSTSDGDVAFNWSYLIPSARYIRLKNVVVIPGGAGYNGIKLYSLKLSKN